ncbi:hypothetical protein KQX54_007199 [Cotesia glomerata]|uniref:Uncharacterized protein n=1 Tax=Cotesia glomerata TaxID=32391 RepID=A0AAV7I7X4_COTGL|nr:hypothetical protein KQX54_007199 [Cotesia glomerata]
MEARIRNKSIKYKRLNDVCGPSWQPAGPTLANNTPPYADGRANEKGKKVPKIQRASVEPVPIREGKTQQIVFYE